MRKIPIYKAELQDGIADRILASANISYASVIEVVNTKPDNINTQILDMVKATNNGQIDLFYMQSILATIGWNKNDDVFDKIETWVARATPEDKPLNYEHNCKDIIGHITSNYVIDGSGKVISNDTAIEDIPDKFHIVNSEVLYKYWEDKQLLDRMKTIIAEIAEGKWFVSMEALFDNFDYAVVTSKGENKVIARNQDSAFLTKHLRAYGGKGEYEGAKVGRLIKNIVFSGKGLVRKPANPDSIIFDSVQAFEQVLPVSAQEIKKIGYTNNRGESSKEILMATEISQVQVDTLQNEIKRLEATIQAANTRANEAEKRLGDMNAQSVQAKLDGFAADIKSRDEKINALTTQVQTEQKSRLDVENKLTKAQEEVDTYKKLVEDAKAEYTKTTRISFIAKELALNEVDATKFYNDEVSDLNMNEDRFKKFVATIKAQKPVDNKNTTTSTAATVLNNATTVTQNPPLGDGGNVNASVEQTRAKLSKSLGGLLHRNKKGE